MLSGLNNQGKDDGSGATGDDTMLINPFDLIYEKLSKEIELMMQTASQLMQLKTSNSWKSET